MRFYLWRRERLEHVPVRAAIVEVEAGRVTLIEHDDPDIAEVAAALAGYPDLPLHLDEPAGEGIALTERFVPPDHPGYGYAFGQAMARACLLELSFRPELLRG